LFYFIFSESQSYSNATSSPNVLRPHTSKFLNVFIYFSLPAVEPEAGTHYDDMLYFTCVINLHGQFIMGVPAESEHRKLTTAKLNLSYWYCKAIFYCLF